MSSTPINQSMSLFIAYVFPNIGLHRIINIFQDANLGVVSRVDFIKKTDKYGKVFNTIYIHFHSWSETEEAQKFQYSIRDPEAKTTLQYDGPWFWIVLENIFNKREKTEVIQNMYRSLPKLQRKFTLNLSEDCAVKHIDPILIERITAATLTPTPTPIHHKSNLFKHSYWNEPTEELSTTTTTTTTTSTLLAQILKIQKEHAQEIEQMKMQVKENEKVKVEKQEQYKLEYLRQHNFQLQQELDSIKKNIVFKV